MNGSLQLFEYPGDIVRLSREKCGRKGQYRKQKLIERTEPIFGYLICARKSRSATGVDKCTTPAWCVTSLGNNSFEFLNSCCISAAWRQTFCCRLQSRA